MKTADLLACVELMMIFALTFINSNHIMAVVTSIKHVLLVLSLCVTLKVSLISGVINNFTHHLINPYLIHNSTFKLRKSTIWKKNIYVV